jgi:CRP-like cAMP-binding protein
MSEAFLGVVVQGHLNKRVTDGGRTLIIDTLRPGATFLLNIATSPDEVFLPLYAVRHSVVSVLDRDSLIQAFALLPTLWMAVFVDVGRRLASTEERLEEMTFAPGRTQLARLLLRLTLARGKVCISGISQHQLARLLGIHRESLTTLLTQMREDGMIKTNRLYLEILNEDALRQLADAGTGEWLNGSLPGLDPEILQGDKG